MISLTQNESKVIEFLVRNFVSEYNINQVARELEFSPRGSFKILKKLESQNVLKSKKMGNAIFYQINFDDELALQLCNLVLIKKKLKPIVKVIIQDIQKLKKITQCAVIFGSILKRGEKAGDADLLVVFRKNRFDEVQKIIREANQISPKKIHLIMQTKGDLLKNIKNRNKAILDLIKEGAIVWGPDILVQTIKKSIE